MKKAFSLFLCLVMLITLCSCSGFRKQIDDARNNDTVNVTIIEGYTAIQIADLLEEKKVCDASAFLEACNTMPDNFSYATKIENKDERVFLLEGYLYPDTYTFYVGEGAENALLRLLSNFAKKITDEYKSKAEELGMSMDEVITLASIIQNEAGTYDEMVNVSSVFHNRLNTDETQKKLQSDVTILYVKEKLKSYLDEASIEKYMPLYSTYDLAGLPAGPICNPGEYAIKAALYPTDTNYYFFFVDKNGKYYYNEDYENHLSQWNSLPENQ